MRKIVGLLLLLFQTSCYVPLDVESQIPLGRFEPSLVKHEETKLTLGAGTQPVADITVANDAAKYPPDLNGGWGNSYNILMRAGINPNNRMELEFRVPTSGLLRSGNGVYS